MEPQQNRNHRPGLAGAVALGLALAALTACESITGVAPEDTPRVEIELAVVVDDAFVEPLADVGPDSALYDALREAVREKADLGLRFYPTPSDRYAESDRRPPYLMTVELQRLTVDIDHELVEEEGAEPRIDASVDAVGCAVRASVERRRADAPALLVSTSKASSKVRAETDAGEVAEGRGYATRFEGATPKVLEGDIVRAVEIAVDRALRAMRTPIDREFAHEAEAAAPASAAEGS